MVAATLVPPGSSPPDMPRPGCLQLQDLSACQGHRAAQQSKRNIRMKTSTGNDVILCTQCTGYNLFSITVQKGVMTLYHASIQLHCNKLSQRNVPQQWH